MGGTTEVLWCDYSYARPDVSPFAGVMRYLDDRNPATTRPDLTKAEVDAIHAKGKPIGLIWEMNQDKGRAAKGYDVGVADAKAANASANDLGAPATAAIFYTVDADLTPTQIAPYFKGVRSVAGRPVGIYGSARVVDWGASVGIAYRWQTKAWSSGVVSTNAHLYQRDFLTGLDQSVFYRPFPAWGPTPAPQEASVPITSYIYETQYTNLWNYTPADKTAQTWGSAYPRRIVRGITIHHWGSDGSSFAAIRNYLASDNDRNNSAHYVAQGATASGAIDHRVACIVDPDDAAWHAGSAYGNVYTIGIECRPEARDEDYLVVAELIRRLRSVYGDIPLYPHKHWMPTSCPGRWDLARLDRLARSTTTTTTPTTTPTTEADMTITDTALAVWRTLVKRRIDDKDVFIPAIQELADAKSIGLDNAQRLDRIETMLVAFIDRENGAPAAPAAFAALPTGEPLFLTATVATPAEIAAVEAGRKDVGDARAAGDTAEA